MAQNARARAKITVTFNQKNIKKVQKEIQEAHIKTTEDVLNDLIESQYVPYITGELQESLKVDKNAVTQGRMKIVADSPHADDVYHNPERKISRKINKNARAHFFGPYIRGNKKEFYMDAFAKNYKNKNGKMVKK